MVRQREISQFCSNVKHVERKVEDVFNFNASITKMMQEQKKLTATIQAWFYLNMGDFAMLSVTIIGSKLITCIIIVKHW